MLCNCVIFAQKMILAQVHHVKMTVLVQKQAEQHLLVNVQLGTVEQSVEQVSFYSALELM